MVQRNPTMEKNPITVLIVDDNAEYAGILKHHLDTYAGAKFRVLLARDGEEVDEILRGNPGIDIILMDYYLPEGNGLQITRRISEGPNPIPVVLLTSSK